MTAAPAPGFAKILSVSLATEGIFLSVEKFYILSMASIDLHLSGR